MSIAKSKYYYSQEALNQCNHQLSSLCQLYANKLPEDLYSVLTYAKKEFETYNINNSIEKQILEGDVFSADELLTMIKKSTLDNAWSISSDINEKVNTQYYKDTYNIEYNDSQVIQYFFVRDYKSRDDIFLIRVTCLPNRLCHAYYETGRADLELSSDLLNESEFKEALTKKFTEL